MRIYIFKSETRKELRAFAGDPGGSKLPSQHGPWTVTGVVESGRVDGVDISGPVNLPPPCLWRRCPVLHHDRVVSALITQFVHWRIIC